MGTCHKCGQDVPMSNDKGMFLAIYTGQSGWAYLAPPQHLLPTDKCEGSPSIAQYWPGQPKDTRGYDYDERAKQPVRDAIVTMQQKYGQTNMQQDIEEEAQAEEDLRFQDLN